MCRAERSVAMNDVEGPPVYCDVLNLGARWRQGDPRRTLIRRSDCQTAKLSESIDGSLDLETRWRMAMDVEQRKRLALLCFLWDTQHAVLFSQSLCMSAFELRTTLPCNPDVWEAESAAEWSRCHF